MANRHPTPLGETFGRLTVTGDAPSVSGEAGVTARCICGVVKTYVLRKLRSGRTKSCGCLNSEINRLRSKDNPKRKNRTYRAWVNMRMRCLNTNTINWKDYGGRGVTICDRWIQSFENFLSDMGECPDGLSLDRYPDVNGNYEPSNCRWATRIEQNNNTRSNIRLNHHGESLTISEWAHRLGFSVATLHDRYKRGWPAEKILTTTPSVGRNQFAE